MTLILFSPMLYALGLGGATVESFLNQPLNVRVELISRSSEELQSISSGLASTEDFELLGLSRSAISVPLRFETVTNTANPYVRITSRLPIYEPVVQLLIQVAWSNGRMLREYTLFLDPPTFESQAPPVSVRPAPTPQPEVAVEPPPQKQPEPAAVIQRAPDPVLVESVTDEPTTPEQSPEETVSVDSPSREPVTTEPESAQPPMEDPEENADSTNVPSAEDPLADEAGAEESIEQETQASEPAAEEPAVDDQIEQEPEAEVSAVEEEQSTEGEIHGPVARGETLWGIARDWSRGTGYGINQTMLALQRKNPEAFIRGNINSLKQGAILRMPSFSEIGQLSSRQAMLEVMRQEQEIRSGIRTTAPDFVTPTVADSTDFREPVVEQTPEPVQTEELGHLELVPPAADDTDTVDSGQSSQVTDSELPEQPIEEELARTEEDLVNARQENEYLSDRIKELEEQVSTQQDIPVEVEDSDLAGMETSLADQRASDEPEPPVALTPGGEEEPWYAGSTIWLVGIAVVLISLIIWGLRRRSAMAGITIVEAIDQETVQVPVEKPREFQPVSVPGEATRVQEPEPREDTVIQQPEAEEETVIQQPEPEPEEETAIQQPVPKPDVEETIQQTVPEPEEEEQAPASDDPEVSLDLARAYLSMGDKEAARSMLGEAIQNGNAEQVAEARLMMEEL